MGELPQSEVAGSDNVNINTDRWEQAKSEGSDVRV